MCIKTLHVFGFIVLNSYTYINYNYNSFYIINYTLTMVSRLKRLCITLQQYITFILLT